MASLKEKFVEELDYLRRLGRVFSRRNPALEPFLGTSAKDADVERLLEGCAFLTAKLRLKIEDDLPEITQPLLMARDPACLQPTPSMTIMRFRPMDGALTTAQRIPRGTLVQSRRVKGVRCQFRTCTEVTLLPLAIEAIDTSQSNDSSTLRITLTASPGASLHKLGCDHLEFHLSGSDENALMLYGWLGRQLRQIHLESQGRQRILPPDSLRFSGFSPDEALLPQAAGKLDGYRILQEYFCYPTRFHFFRVTGLRHLWPSEPCQQAVLEFRFNAPMPRDHLVKTGDLSLFCTPAINLFPCLSPPISLDEPKVDVPLQPAGQNGAEPWDIFSVDGVSCIRRATSGASLSPEQRLRPISAAGFRLLEREEAFYHYDVSSRLVPDGLDHRIAFLHGDGSAYVASDEIARVNLTCSNGQLPSSLQPGDISHQVDTTTNLAEFTNLTTPTQSYLPELGGDRQWGWISNLSPHQLTLASVPALIAFLRVYDLPGLSNIQLARATQRKLGAIRSISTTPVERMFRELPVRGSSTHLQLDPDAYLSEGEMHLLFSVLSHALSVFCTTQSFHVLSIATAPGQTPYQWPLRLGTQPLM